MRIWVFLVGMLGMAQVGLAVPVLKYHQEISKGKFNVHFRVYEDDDQVPEGCESYYAVAAVTMAGNEPYDKQKLCFAYNLRGVDVGGAPIFFADKIGGNAAGWALYRYDPIHKKVDYYDFNSRGGAVVVGTQGSKVRLKILIAHHDLVHMGYLPDEVQIWEWDNKSNKPIKIKQ